MSCAYCMPSAPQKSKESTLVHSASPQSSNLPSSYGALEGEITPEFEFNIKLHYIKSLLRKNKMGLMVMDD